jgi:hypothetical protein
MTTPSHRLKQKAQRLGISEEVVACALALLSQNKNLVNAIDHSVEMDDYIYRAVIRQFSIRRRKQAEIDMDHSDATVWLNAEKELSVVSREELYADPFYRSVLPLLNKVFIDEPILRLYADEALAVVQMLAEFKRRHRATSVTEVMVKRCSAEIEEAYNSNAA